MGELTPDCLVEGRRLYDLMLVPNAAWSDVDAHQRWVFHHLPALLDAAAEVDRLRAARDECERQLQEWVGKVTAQMNENDRLRAAIRSVVQEVERIHHKATALTVCAACRVIDWPCPTYRAIEPLRPFIGGGE